MNIVTGRGNNRRVVSLPCAAVVKAAPEKDQKEAVSLVCEILQINGK